LFTAVAESGARVLLMGMGGDALVAGGWPAWGEMMARGDLAALIPHLWRYYRYFGTRPPVRGVWIRHRMSVRTPPLVAPLDPDFAAEQGLEERWRDVTQSWLNLDDRKTMTGNPFWSEMFSGFDPESMKLPLKVRQPFFDVRLYEEAMRLPPTPWQFGKTIMRRAGEAMLPEAILTRPKTPYSGNVYFEAARLGYEPWLADLEQARELEGFVDLRRLGGYANDLEGLGRNRYHQGVMYPAGLAAWLRTRKY
jgi:asparagine synthase (glutamine-hydrolysing)